MQIYFFGTFCRTKSNVNFNHLLDPEGTHLMPIHQNANIVEWWYMWRNESWLSFLRRMKKNVSQNSSTFEK